MRKNKPGSWIILGSFILLICLPWFFWFFLEELVDTTNYENRQYASRPRLTLGSYIHFATDYTNYLNDSIPFRNSLVTLNNAIDYFIYNTSPDTDVIIGKDNWLFYGTTGDGNPLSCYQGNNLLSENELVQIAENCLRQRDYLASLGKAFIIYIAPNKERIYSEYMPDCYGLPAENYRALQIYRYLSRNTDLHVVYAYDELMQTKRLLSDNLYYKTDTHWNAVGGYVGARLLLHELDIDIPAIDSDQIRIIHGNQHSGDLAGMLNLSKQLEFSDPEYSVAGYPMNHFERLDGDILTSFDCKASSPDHRKLYILRDSFAIAMYPYLGSQFSETFFRHYDTDLHEDFLEHDPDIVVMEVVERKLDALATFSI